jgi:hypothetical protein
MQKLAAHIGRFYDVSMKFTRISVLGRENGLREAVCAICFINAIIERMCTFVRLSISAWMNTCAARAADHLRCVHHHDIAATISRARLASVLRCESMIGVFARIKIGTNYKNSGLAAGSRLVGAGEEIQQQGV